MIDTGKYIKLTQGKKTLVDSDCYEYLARYKWHAVKGKSTWYAARNITNDQGLKRIEFMHRKIMQARPGLYVDHINHNGLDNRCKNLRVCSHSDNTKNQRKTRGSSKYKGVYWNKKDRRWLAQIQANNKRLHIGSFKNEEEAARAYNSKAIEMHGEFAHINKL